MTLSSWFSTLPVSPTALETRPTFLTSSLPPTLLLILSNYTLRWAPPITILFLCTVLSLQYGLRIHRGGGASGTMPLLVGMTWGCIFLIFRGMIIVSRPETPLCVLSASQRWLSPEWRHTFHVLSLLLMLKSPGSITLVLLLSKIERWPIKGTVAFQLLKIMPFTSQPGITPNLLSDLQKTPSSIENAETLLTQTRLKISGT